MGHKRSYSVGRRNDKNIPKQTPGKMSKNRWAWCTVYFGQFVIWADFHKDAEGAETDEVADIKLVYPIPNRPAVSWNLTALTVDELNAVEALITSAIAMARPYCEQRDQEAKDAFEQGDDSHSRIYRSVPQLVYRERSEREYREGVQHGSEDAAAVSSGGGTSPDALRGHGSDMAERDEGDGSTQDDWQASDESAGLREVGGLGDGAPGVPSPYSVENSPPPTSGTEG